MSGGLGGIVGSMMGVGGGPQKSLDLWLYSRNAKPAPPEATHDIPPALNMGSALPLMLPRVEKGSPPEDGTPGKTDQPEAMFEDLRALVDRGQQPLLDIDDKQRGSVSVDQHGSGPGPVESSRDGTPRPPCPPTKCEYFTDSLCNGAQNSRLLEPRLPSNTPTIPRRPAIAVWDIRAEAPTDGGST